MKVYNNPLDIPIPPAIYENTVEAAYRLGVINAQADLPTLPWEPVTDIEALVNLDVNAQYLVLRNNKAYAIEAHEYKRLLTGKIEYNWKYIHGVDVTWSDITDICKITPPEAEGISDAS